MTSLLPGTEPETSSIFKTLKFIRRSARARVQLSFACNLAEPIGLCTDVFASKCFSSSSSPYTRSRLRRAKRWRLEAKPRGGSTSACEPAFNGRGSSLAFAFSPSRKRQWERRRLLPLRSSCDQAERRRRRERTPRAVRSRRAWLVG